MFIFKKKIRKLLDLLDSGKRPADLQDVVHAIEKNAPHAPRPQFQNKLKQELLMKFSIMPKTQPEKEKPGHGYSFKFKGLAFAMALLLVVVVSGIVSYPLIPAPQVEGYSLKENVRQIADNAPIKVVFTQPMDRASVESAFHIEPQVKGRFEWKNNSMLFYPEEKFQNGKTFAVTVEKKAKSLFQKPLAYDYEENFEITGPPQVLLFSPAPDSEYVDTGSKVTVLFDRPMTALTTLDQGETAFPDIKIDPPVKGKFKWLGTSSVTFMPADRLQNATKYTVTIPKGTVSAEGGSTEQDFTASFSTPKPAVMQSFPYDMDRFNGPDTKPQIDFNQPMDPTRAKQFLHLYVYKEAKFDGFDRGAAGILENVDLKTGKVQGFDSSKWTELTFNVRNKTADDIKAELGRISSFSGEARLLATEDTSDLPDADTLKKSLVLVPEQKLDYNTVYLVKIDKGLPGSEGTFTLEQDQGTLFKTVGKIEVVSTSPANGADLSKSEDSYFGGAEITFSHPMDTKSLEDKVVLSPLKKDKDTNETVKPTFSGGSEDVTLNIIYNFEPSTEYTVTLKAGGKDLYGQTMAEDYSFKFKTAALHPEFSLATRSDINILDANKAPVFYVKSTNVDTLHFNFRKLSQEEFEKVYSRGYLNYDVLNSLGGPFISWDRKVNNEFNKQVVTKIDFDKESAGEKIGSGIFYFDLTSPGVLDSYDRRPVTVKEIFIVTGTGLAVKRSQTDVLVWATSLKDGAPSAGLDVKVLDPERKVLASGKTDKDGLAVFSLPAPKTETDFYSNDVTVEAVSEGDFTLAHSSWSEGVDPWNFNISYDAYQPDYYIYSYTDRPIYRPGHTVYFKGLVRKDVDAKFKLPDVKKIHVAIKDSQYETVFEKDLDLNSNGTYNGDLALGENVRTGNYTIESTVTGAPGPEYLNKFYTYFRIAEYRKPDYELKMETDKENYVNGDKAKITVDASYFFGAPLPGAPLDYTVKAQDYYFFLPYDGDSPYASQWYSFSDDGYSCYWGCEPQNSVVTEAKAKLDEKGRYTIELPLDISKKKLSQIYTVEGTVTDLNYQTVSSRVSLPVHAGEFYVGILNQDYVVSQADPVKFDVISVDYNGKPLPGKTVDVTLYKRSWNTVKKKNVDSDFYYENSYEDIKVETKTVTTDDKAHAVVSFTAKEGGYFKGTAEAKDSKGNSIKASTTVYVTSEKFLNWGRENNDKIELVADKNEYKPGETAKILVKSPYGDVWALVTQERKNIIDKKVVKIKSNSDTIEIPITDDSIPNVFVSVLLVKGDAASAGLTEPAPGANDERDVAAFKLGYATLQVNTSSREMKIDVQTDKPKYHPGDDIKLKVKTVDSADKPVKAEVSIAVVDKSVLSLTETVTADLLNAFYRTRFLGVMTSHTLTKAISRVNVQVEAGLKGGGGATPAKRGVFKDTAYWQAVVNTNEGGEGEVTFKLPDNLTTWQIMAIGIDADTLVGSQKTEFVVSKDVMVRSVLPRFLIVKDNLKAGGIVHNYLDKATTFDVSLVATGVGVTSEKSQKLSLNPGEEKKLEWDISVKNEKEAVLTFSAIAENDKTVGDILEQKLPIQPYSFPEVVATSGTIDDDKKHVETVWLPTGVDLNFGEMTLAAAPSLATSITQGLEYLMTFPYGCAEQTASSLLPNAIIKQVIDLPALKNTKVDEKTLKKNVETGVAALYKMQQGNGSWGIWQTSESNPYLTAYVMFTLNEVKKAGYAVDEGVIGKAKVYLQNYLNGNPLQKLATTASPYDKSQNSYQANFRAFAMYVLTETGAGDLALANNLFDYKDDLNISSKAHLAMAYHSLKGGLEAGVKEDLDKKIKALKDSILNEAKETPRGVHFEEKELQYRLFDTNTRSTALVLQMLSRIEPSHPYIPKILRNMLMEKKDGRYASTQETAVTLLAMVDYLKSSKELEPSYNGVITIDGVEKLNKSYTTANIADKDIINIALTELLPDNQDNEITFSRSGVGKMYYDMNLKYYLPTERIKARDEGILVTQEYFSTDDKKMENPLSSIGVGTNLKARMTIIVPEDRYYVMVEDFLPAGLEGVDFSLKTSQTGLQDLEPVYGKGGGKGYYDYSRWAFNYSEVRDDRMMYFADSLPKGVYEIEYFVRATTPGKFHDLPALAQELYFPEVFGRSEGKVFEVR
jgi:alpha-2-macroglobulin